LLLLANSNPKNKNKNKKATLVDDQFVCSCCNKVFGSHQALGGHRASHKNVKGCFANTTSSPTITASSTPQGIGGDHAAVAVAVDSSDPIMPRGGGDVEGEAVNSSNNNEINGVGHKCSICLRVFSTGQALGGHKRCHWEKGEPTTPAVPFDSSSTATATAFNNNMSSSVNVVDLNFPFPPPDDDNHPHSSSPLTLDLRLGL